jgi:hypothetical protein
VLVSKRGPIVCVNCELSNAAPIITAAHVHSASTPLKENEGTMECTLLSLSSPHCSFRSAFCSSSVAVAQLLLPAWVFNTAVSIPDCSWSDVTLTVDPSLPTWCAHRDGELMIRRLDIDSVRVLSTVLAQVCVDRTA